jgi:hypothetical protein
VWVGAERPDLLFRIPVIAVENEYDPGIVKFPSPWESCKGGGEAADVLTHIGISEVIINNMIMHTI